MKKTNLKLNTASAQALALLESKRKARENQKEEEDKQCLSSYVFRATLRCIQNGVYCVDLDDDYQEEMWERPSKFAVMKKGQKKAVKLCDTEWNAQDYILSASMIASRNFYIEPRPGARIRCESYCICKDYCDQYKDFSHHEKLEVKE